MDYKLRSVPFRTRATPNITPFTYYDGATYLEILERLRKWLAEVLTPAFDEVIEIVDGMIQEALEGVERDLNEMREEVQAALDSVAETDAELRAYVDDVLQQVINNSIEVQDPVVAALMADSESATGAVARDVFPVKANLPFANIADYGATLDGETDDGPAVNAAISAVADGGKVTAPNGAYFAASGIVSKDRSISLDFATNRIKRIGSGPLIAVSGSYSDPVTGLVTTRGTASTSISVPDSSPFKVGDTVKVFSDDPIPGGRVTSAGGPMRGTITTVVSSAAGVVSVRPRIYDDMTTNIRVAKMLDVSADVRIGECFDAEDDTSSPKSPMISIGVTAYSTCDIRVSRGAGTGLGSSNNYMGQFKVKASRLTDNSSNGQYGYGVADIGGSHNRYEIYAQFVRHAFTDSPSRNVATPGEADALGYGGSQNCTITGEASYCTNTAWDTHHGGEGHHFDRVRSTGGSIGLAFRGHRHVATAPVLRYNGTAFRTFYETAYSTTESHGHVVTDPMVIGSVNGIAALNRAVAGRSSRELSVYGGRIEFLSRAVTTYNASLLLEGVELVSTGVEHPTDRFYLELWNGSLDGNWRLNLASVAVDTANAFAVINTGSSAAQVVGEIEFTLSAAAADTISALMNNSDNSRSDVSIKHIGALPSSWKSVNAASAYGNHAIKRDRMISDGGSGQSAQDITGSTVTLNQSSDPVVYHRITNNTGAILNITSISPGKKAGQLLILHVVNTSGWGVTVSTGAAVGAGGVTVSQGGTLTCVWDVLSQLWRVVKP